MTRKRLIVIVFFSAASFLCLNSTLAKNDSPFRRVSMTILIDKDLLDKSGASVVKEIEWVVRSGSRIYEKEFKITFTVVAFKPWGLGNDAEDIIAIEALRAVVLAAGEEPSDITIAVTRRQLFGCSEAKNNEEKNIYTEICGKNKIPEVFTGYAYILGDAAIITLNELAEKIFIHEIGHLFGADHTKEVSVMNDEWIDPALFDKASRNIIMRNRDRIFDKMQLP